MSFYLFFTFYFLGVTYSLRKTNPGEPVISSWSTGSSFGISMRCFFLTLDMTRGAVKYVLTKCNP